MEKIINVLIENPYGFVLIIVALFAECIRRTFISNIEILFMRKKEEAKKFVSSILVMCFLCLVINYLLTFDVVLVALDSILFLLFLFAQIIIVIIRAISSWMHKNNKKTSMDRILDFLRLILVLTASPILIYFIATERSYSISWIIIGVSIVETFCTVISCVGLEIKESEIELINCANKEKFYIYKKINEEYLLCGDTQKMKDADKIISIEIKDIYSRKYFLKFRKETGEQVCTETKENSSKE